MDLKIVDDEILDLIDLVFVVKGFGEESKLIVLDESLKFDKFSYWFVFREVFFLNLDVDNLSNFLEVVIVFWLFLGCLCIWSISSWKRLVLSLWW